MEQQDWTLVERLFHEALELPEDSRARLFDSCPPDVRAQVETLLAHSGAGPRVLRTIEQAATLVSQPAGRVGAYRLVREIGQGGMGAVYLAVRADDLYEKQVAIKFVRRGMDSPLLRRRFEEERRLLARLEHPNIARLIDGGETAEGQPYLVMEYVDGRDILTYARECGAGVRQRLELFLSVCAAVQHAHQSLIIHRDLKPGNILIDTNGVPKLLDFGIAKLLDENARSGEATVMRLLTPDYASPEQARGEAPTTATDVYGLGAVLYQLLTGERPFELDGLTASESERVIAEGRIVKPSDRVPELRRQLAGDLDNIVLKAMRTQPGSRYATVAEMAADLRRHLAGEPVAARSYTAAERFAMLLRRHRAAASATAAILVVTAAGGVLTARAAIQARRERAVADRQRVIAETERAEAQRQQARAERNAAAARQASGVAERRLADEQSVIDGFIREIYASMANLPGATPVRREFLELSIPALEKLRAESPDNRELRNTLARAYQLMGELLGRPTGPSLGERQKGLEYLGKARALMEELSAEAPENVDYLMGVGRTLDSMAAIVASMPEGRQKAVEQEDRAIAAMRRAQRIWPRNEEIALALAQFHMNHVRQAAGTERESDSASDLEEARKWIAIAGRGGSRPDLAAQLAGDVESTIGQRLRARNDNRAALPHFEAAARYRDQLMTLIPNDVQAMRLAMLMQSYIGSAYRAIEGPGERARGAYERMAEIAGKMAAADRENLTAQVDLGMAQNYLCQLHRERGDFAAARKAAEQSAAAFRSVGGKMDANQERSFALTLLWLGEAQQRLGGSADALSAWREALATVEALLAHAPADSRAMPIGAAAAIRLGLAVRGLESVEYARRSLRYAEGALAAGETPAGRSQMARVGGGAALVFEREGLRDLARDLARRHIGALAAMRPAEITEWPAEERERIRELAR